ncbi:MAG: hypothetical protein AAF405_03740, partial [Pseudomonadota bacterium]
PSAATIRMVSNASPCIRAPRLAAIIGVTAITKSSRAHANGAVYSGHAIKRHRGNTAADRAVGIGSAHQVTE